jgi:hypothetical protein
VEAPQAQSVSNLKGVFGFEKKPGESAPKVGPPAKAAEPSWVKKPAEEVKPPATAPASGVKPPGAAPSNPWKKADPPAETAPVAPPKPVEAPKVIE